MEQLSENRQKLNKRSYSLGVILAIGISLLAIVSVGITIGVLYFNFSQVSRQDLRQRLINIAELAALQQDGDKFEQITSQDDPLYEEFRLQNLEIRKIDPEIAFVYTMRKDEQGIYFVVDAGEPGEIDIARYGERYFDASPTLQANFDLLESAIADQEIYTDTYGSFLSAYAPIRNSKGERVGVIGVDIRADDIIDRERQFTLISLMVFGAALIILALVGWLFGHLVTAPLRELTRSAHKIALGDLNHRVKIETIATEVAELASDFNSMTSVLQDIVQSLETRVAERTADLEQRTLELEKNSREMQRRASQLRAVTLVARAISSIQDLQNLLPNIASVISKELNVYHVGIFLVDDAKEYAVLVASNSEGGQRMLKRSHKLKIGEEGIVGFSAATGQARIALDKGEDAVYFDNPDLPTTRSEMAIPLRVGENIIGILDVQSEQTGAFDEEDIELLSIVADQISIAIQNAKQFQAAQKAAQEAEEVYRRYIRSEWRTLVRETRRLGYRYSKAGVGPLKAPIHSSEVAEAATTGKTNASNKETRSQIVVPIKLRGEVIGILNVTADSERPWDQDEVDITEAVAERVALAIENVRLLESSQSQASRERTISAVTSRISASVNMRSILQTAVEELGRIIPGSDIVIQLGQKNEDK
jgi:GAF domain-containing protein/HAMP domain-containing protein